jgi:hypothetical protein
MTRTAFATSRVSTAAVLLVLVVAACSSGAGASPNPSGTLPPTTIETPEQAAARVQLVNAGLAGIGPKDRDMIGACCFWEATPATDGFQVVFEVGWGDCPSGCTDRHRWTYVVSRGGGVELVAESGSPVPSGIPGAGGGSTGGGGGGILPGGSGIEGRVLAGPTCPVVTANDPNCADRPVANATLVVLDASGTEVARIATDANGHYEVTLPAGPYTIEPQPVEGFMRVAGPIPVTVGDGYATVDVSLDTGIR